MHSKLILGGRGVMQALAAVVLGSLVASSVVAADDVSVTQSALGYVAGTKLVVECQIDYPVDKTVQSLLWTPSLPAGWSLDATAAATTGHGVPNVDPDGLSVIFLAQDLSLNNPIVFQYTINVPSGVTGTRIVNGVLEYQLDNMPNPAEVSPLEPLLLQDATATHAAFGYLAGRLMTVTNTFSHPTGVALQSLLWRPMLPSTEWQLVSAAALSANCTVAVDPDGDAIILLGQNITANPLTFIYTVLVPTGVTGEQQLRGEVEYQLAGMDNPATMWAEPDPLILRELHTYEIVSAEGQCSPAVGVYTNFHGTELSATVNTPLIVGTRTFACTGWTLTETSQEPVIGSSANKEWTLNHDAILTWHWVAPLISSATPVYVNMVEDGLWSPPGITASEPYRTELEATLEWSITAAPTGGTATVTGIGTTPAINYAPAQDWYGTDSFVVEVADGLGGFDHVTIIITVAAVNDPPVLATIGAQQTDEFTPLTFTAVATDVDLPAQTLTYSISGAPANATFDTATGEFNWVPEAGQAGTEGAVYTVTVTVTDNGTSPDNLSDSEIFTITLLPVRATHSTIGYIPGQLLAIDCEFSYPAARNLRSLLWRPELPADWFLKSASGGGTPSVDPDGEAIVLLASSLGSNPISFTYYVQVPLTATDTNAIGGLIEYQLNGMNNPSEVRAQPDPLIIPMRLTLPELTVADKVYDGLTNATIVTYGTLAGVMAGHEVQLVTTTTWAFFDTPNAGETKQVTVGGLALSGANASWYTIENHVVTAAVNKATLTVTADNKDKVYDGVVFPAEDYTVTYDGFIPGEDKTALGGTLAFEGTAITAVNRGTHLIMPKGLTSGNYDIEFKVGELEIKARVLTVTASENTKIYDGTMSALALPTGDALQNNDTITSGETYDNANVGTTHVLTPSTVVIMNAAGTVDETANYDISIATIATGVINQRTLTVTPTTGQSKIFGATDPTFAYGNSGAEDGEIAAFTGALSRGSGENIGATYKILGNDLALADNAAFKAANYELAFTENVTFEIKVKEVSELTISDIAALTYNGAAQTPEPTVYDGTTLLVKDTDYTLSYTDNTDAGTATLTVTYQGNYSGTQSVTFTINRLTINVTADALSKAYGDSDPVLTCTLTPALIGTDTFTGALSRDAGEAIGTFAINQGTLVLGDNYTLDYTGANFSINALNISGTIFNDSNRLIDGIVNGTGGNAGGMFVNLVNPDTHAVIASVAVAANGTYSFSTADGVAVNANYAIILSASAQTVGASLTSATLPASWISTGEHLGAGSGDDGTVDSVLPITTTNVDLSQANFGIAQVPDIAPVIAALPNAMFGVTDFEVRVRCLELKGVDTAGTITMRIPKDNRWVMLPSWNPGLTHLPTSNETVQNSLWTHTEDSTAHIFTTTKAILGSKEATFGFEARWSAGTTQGSYAISVAITPGSGGEARFDNSTGSTTVTYSY